MKTVRLLLLVIIILTWSSQSSINSLSFTISGLPSLHILTDISRPRNHPLYRKTSCLLRNAQPQQRSCDKLGPNHLVRPKTKRGKLFRLQRACVKELLPRNVHHLVAVKPPHLLLLPAAIATIRKRLGKACSPLLPSLTLVILHELCRQRSPSLRSSEKLSR